MDSNERYRILSTGRGNDFRNLVRDLTNDPRDFPGKNELRARIAEIYPGDEHAPMREVMFDKLTQIGQARRAGMDLMELRGIGDEWVIKVETELAEADQLLPPEDTAPVDVSGVIEGIDNFDPTAKRERAIQGALKNAELEANRVRQMGGN